MGIRSDELEFVSHRSVADIGRTMQAALAAAKARSIDQIQSSSGALAAFDDRADIEVVAQGQGFMSGGWAVQIYVFDEGERRRVSLIALGDGGFTRAMAGATNSVSLSASKKKRDQLANALR
jgi:hypothetical protein